MKLTPRPYQVDTVNKLAESYNTTRSILLVSPTGSGKTVIASMIIERAIQSNKKIIFIAHRKEIIDQTSKKLDYIGITHGVMMGNDKRYNPNANVQIASIQTLIKRNLPDADLIIVDECHRATSESYKKIINSEKYANALVLGMTATPYRTDGHGFDQIFNDMVVVASVRKLVNDGYLLAPTIYTPFRPDLSKIRITAGDYNETDLTYLMSKSHLINGIVNHWIKNANNKRTIVFACSRQHSKHIVEAFRKANITAEHLDYETPVNERDRILQGLANGTIRVVSNVNILTEGWDLPQLECAIIARPTISESLYMQMVGRVMRVIENKTHAMVFDHAGCFFMHNSPIADRTFSLKSQKNKIKKFSSNNIVICPDCYKVSSKNTNTCICGYDLNTDKLLPSCHVCHSQNLVKNTVGYYSRNAIEHKCAKCGTPNIQPIVDSRKLPRLIRYAEFEKILSYGIIKEYTLEWAINSYKNMFGITPDQDGIKIPSM